jgi:acyl-CoA synthetase (AMP-forming)/AMP-acid ligase II
VRIDLVARFAPEETARALAEDGVTVFSGVPAIYAQLLSLAATRGAPLAAPSLRYMSVGGAPLDLALKREVEAMFGIPLCNGYGLTETSPTVSTTAIDDPRDDDSAGTLLEDVEVRILGKHGTALPAGEVGELWVRGGLVMKGYYRDSKRTAEVLTPEGWLKTGDLARLSADGNLYILGRLKELIIRSGFNVSPWLLWLAARRTATRRWWPSFSRGPARYLIPRTLPPSPPRAWHPTSGRPRS